MIKFKPLIESLDYPYKYRHSFKTEEIDYEDEESGETYKKDVLCPVQLIPFKTESGISYLWYARQSRYDDKLWEIAFGVETGMDADGTHKLDIKLTGTGNSLRVFATVISIINSFVEFDNDNYEIQRLTFTSKGDKRTKVYIKALVPRIEKFKIEHTIRSGDETTFILSRYD